MPSNIKYKKYTYKSSTKAPAFTAASPSVGGVRGGYFDAQLGRFWQVDALAELDYSTSVYAFANNNPVYFNDPWGLQTEDPNKANGFKKKYDGNVNNLPNASEGVTVTGTRKKGLPPPPPAGANATPPRPITMGDIASSSNEAANTGGNNGGGNGGGGMQTVYTEGALSQGGQGGGNEPASKAEYHRKGGVTPASSTKGTEAASSENWAVATLSFITFDISVPDPSDAAPPKWAAYAGAASVASLYLLIAGNGNKNYPGPLTYTYEHPSQNPIHRTPQGFDPNETPPGLGTAAKILIGSRMIYEMYDEYQQQLGYLKGKPFVPARDNTTVVKPYYPSYRPK